MPAVPENRADRHVSGRPSLAMGAPLQPRHGRHQLRERRSGASLGRKPAGRRASLTRTSQGCRIADLGASSTWGFDLESQPLQILAIHYRRLPVASDVVAGCQHRRRFRWLPVSPSSASVAAGQEGDGGWGWASR